jgi:hypothetical protein
MFVLGILGCAAVLFTLLPSVQASNAGTNGVSVQSDSSQVATDLCNKDKGKDGCGGGKGGSKLGSGCGHGKPSSQTAP